MHAESEPEDLRRRMESLLIAYRDLVKRKTSQSDNRFAELLFNPEPLQAWNPIKSAARSSMPR